MVRAVKVFSRGRVNVGRGSAVSVVDQDVNLAHPLDHFGHEAGDTIGLPLVEAQTQVALAGQGGGKLYCFVRSAAGDHHPRPRFGQSAADGRAQPAAGPGDDGYPAL